MKFLLFFTLLIWLTEQAEKPVGWCDGSPASPEGCGEEEPLCLTTDTCALPNTGPDCGYECMKSQTETITYCGKRKCAEYAAKDSLDCNAAKASLRLSPDDNKDDLKSC